MDIAWNSVESDLRRQLARMWAEDGSSKESTGTAR